MNKKIVVPIDFSDASRNAYFYAQHFAAEFNADLELIHVAPVPIVPEYSANAQTVYATSEALKDRLSSFLQENSPANASGGINTMVETKINVIQGMVVPSIIELCESLSAFMIVMATNNSHNPIEHFLGSVSSNTARKAPCPVLLIPNGLGYRPFENLLYASNMESTEPEMVNRILDLANIFRAAIHFIHIWKEKPTAEEFSNTEERLFQQLFKDGDPAFSFNMASHNTIFILPRSATWAYSISYFPQCQCV